MPADDLALNAPAAPDVLLGLRAGLPVALGYLPVAFAFGASASALSITAAEATGIPVLMYSGANQAFLLMCDLPTWFHCGCGCGCGSGCGCGCGCGCGWGRERGQ